MNAEERAKELSEENRHLREQVKILQAQVDGDRDQALWRLQSKIDRQRKALDILNRKVLSQRFRLRIAEALGKSITKEEYLAEKAKLADPLADRVLDFEPVAG